MISDSEHRFRMDRLLWCLCADAEIGALNPAEVWRGALAADGATYCSEIIHTANRAIHGHDRGPFDLLTHAIFLSLCPHGDADSENERELHVAPLYHELKRRLREAASRSLYPVIVPELQRPDAASRSADEEKAKRRYEAHHEEMTEAFYVWAETNTDRIKWDDFVDLTDNLIAIWGENRHL